MDSSGIQASAGTTSKSMSALSISMQGRQGPNRAAGGDDETQGYMNMNVL